MLPRFITSGIYAVICALTFVVVFVLVEYFDALAYDVVTVFIGIIVLSNCLAKLYAQHILKDDI